jgi:malate dehydrogenase
LAQRARCSDGSYGVEQDLISSFSDRVQLDKWQIEPGVPINEFTARKSSLSQ